MNKIGTKGRSKNIAVVGAGISGLSAAWLLSARHRVTLFEKEARLGGHSNTVEVAVNGRRHAVDTGFIVYNDHNYPNLVALFDHLGVKSAATNMSFSVSIGNGAVEYAGSDLNGLFAQRGNLLRPRFWRMIGDIRRFYREAPLFLVDPTNVSLGAYLAAGGYSRSFIYDHLVPMGAAIWSTPPDQMLAFPAASFIRFCDNHGLLRLSDRPQWRTVTGGSRQYVDKLAHGISGQVRLADGAVAIHRRDGDVLVRQRSGHTETFDDVVIATHANEALSLLGSDATHDERRLLGAFHYQRNRAVLHGDPSWMPKRKAAWACWNYLADGGTSPDGDLAVTYWMNRLQHIDQRDSLFVTLNPSRPPATNTIHAEFDYEHPVFDHATEAAQRQLWRLQGSRNIWFCGAYFGWGFHEDGLQAGLAVAEQLGGVDRPWSVAGHSSRIHQDGRFAEAAE